MFFSTSFLFSWLLALQNNIHKISTYLRNTSFSHLYVHVQLCIKYKFFTTYQIRYLVKYMYKIVNDIYPEE